MNVRQAFQRVHDGGVLIEPQQMHCPVDDQQPDIPVLDHGLKFLPEMSKAGAPAADRMHLTVADLQDCALIDAFVRDSRRCASTREHTPGSFLS